MKRVPAGAARRFVHRRAVVAAVVSGQLLLPVGGRGGVLTAYLQQQRSPTRSKRVTRCWAG